MRHGIAIAALAAAVIAGVASTASAETVNGVTVLRGPSAEQRGRTTVLRGAPITPGSSASGIGSGSSAPPATGNAGLVLDRSGTLNGLHTGSANAGGEIGNPPPGAGR